MNVPRLAAALLAAFLFAPTVRAYTGCDSLVQFNERKRLRAPLGEAFAAKRFADVDRHFAKILADMDKGKITDADAAFEFGLFETDRPDREALHSEWIKAYPKSEAAYLAQARYFTRRGWNARGDGFIRETSRNQLAAMQESFDRAMQSLESAERLAKRPTLEWAGRIELLRAYGGREGPREAASLYQRGITTYPSTVVVRVAYVIGRAARWGGGTRETLQVVEEAKGLPEAERRYVEAEAQAGLACDADCAQKNLEAAIPHYERMFALCPAFVNGMRRVVSFYGQKRDLAKVIDLSDRIIAQMPGNGESYWDRAWAHVMQNKMPEAFADYQRSAQLGFAKAYVDLGGFYQMGLGGAPRDLKKALELCTVAYQRGVPEGKECADRVRGIMQRNP